MKKCVLVYGLKDSEIRKIERLSIKVVKVTNKNLLMTIGDLLNNCKVSADTFSKLKSDEKAVIFDGFTDNELQSTIKTIRTFLQGGVLAVVTESSRKWTFKYLVDHLVDEREWFKKNNQGDN
ncbi:DUF3783 domain-containing protein [Clostridium sp. BJN0001]|uniref:DUF3783 domain-containing protein n=1 Tax=Clostridium sp. BJN0001 TaxID=2930219 RepID=UPI001FD1C966|nr:DUF3783 domain-containing protein [Clostridium sp. BJN0001]